ncbi:hypothetical protein CSV86_029460 [Pseudomonas putida CSV86]|uniref:Uncharacterized protein n=1 Tax=Pseudomonas bharatica CSV86 TaxID=1005395 RepID=A0A7K4EMS3_9PSED|nr:hypothetical protein [Pseudomonas bharatica]NNJ18946.1 hypothetical protein [Pseudomonas bharatica CSV86]
MPARWDRQAAGQCRQYPGRQHRAQPRYAITLNGAVNVGGTADLTLSGLIDGTGSPGQGRPTNLTLTGTNTYNAPRCSAVPGPEQRRASAECDITVAACPPWWAPLRWRWPTMST